MFSSSQLAFLSTILCSRNKWFFARWTLDLKFNSELQVLHLRQSLRAFTAWVRRSTWLQVAMGTINRSSKLLSWSSELVTMVTSDCQSGFTADQQLSRDVLCFIDSSAARDQWRTEVDIFMFFRCWNTTKVLQKVQTRQTRETLVSSSLWLPPLLPQRHFQHHLLSSHCEDLFLLRKLIAH